MADSSMSTVTYFNFLNLMQIPRFSFDIFYRLESIADGWIGNRFIFAVLLSSNHKKGGEPYGVDDKSA
jgi:hypothetical protein